MATGTQADILIDQLMALSRADKKLVLHRLLDSLLQDEGETWEQAWEKELLRRQEKAERGEAVYHSGPEAMAKLREKYT